MDTKDIIAKRLALLPKALRKSAADICRETKISASEWSMFESGERRITLRSADRLKKRYGVTYDWIYDGDPRSLPHELATMLYAADRVA